MWSLPSWSKALWRCARLWQKFRLPYQVLVGALPNCYVKPLSVTKFRAKFSIVYILELLNFALCCEDYFPIIIHPFGRTMDFSKCFDILSSRKHADPNCPCCTIPPIPPVSTDHQGDFAYLQQKSNLELIESFFHLQTQRIEVRSSTAFVFTLVVTIWRRPIDCSIHSLRR